MASSSRTAFLGIRFTIRRESRASVSSIPSRVAIALEPLIFDHPPDEIGPFGPSIGEQRFEGDIRSAGEALQRFERIPAPFAGEDVVVINVDDDAGEPVELRRDPRHATANDRVRIGEAVDEPMEPNAVLHFRRQRGEFGGLGEIRDDAAEQEPRVRIGQVQVGQEVHDRSRSGAMMATLSRAPSISMRRSLNRIAIRPIKGNSRSAGVPGGATAIPFGKLS